MTTPRDIAIPLERITWRTGQTLASRDLRAETSYLDRLRWMHVRYQHRTWGVVTGLRVARIGKGVALTAGFALDILGRELLLPLSPFAPPDITPETTVYLVIFYSPGSRSCTPAPDLSALCPGAKNLLPLLVGELAWKTADQVRHGLDVLLARVLVAESKVQAVDTTVQRAAGGANSLTWSDITQSGQTGWTDGATGDLTEIQATVDTSDAGFVDTPAYFATVTGATKPVLSFVSAASASSFTLVLRTGFPSRAATQAEATSGGSPAAAAEKAGWQIAWFAIEQKGTS